MSRVFRRIGLVENEQAFRASFEERARTLPGVESVATWKSAEEYWRDPNRFEIDILFLDIGLPHMSGVDLAGLITQANCELPIVMLTNLMSEEIILKAIRNGAIGYILKSELKDLGGVFETVQSGGAIITPTVALRVLMSLKGDVNAEPVNLSDREKQVLNEIVTGATTAETARTLGISENTVRAHVKAIYRKLQVSSRVELMRRAMELGLM